MASGVEKADVVTRETFDDDQDSWLELVPSVAQHRQIRAIRRGMVWQLSNGRHAWLLVVGDCDSWLDVVVFVLILCEYVTVAMSTV